MQEHWALEKGTSNTTPAAPKVGPITAFLGPISRSNSGFSRSNSGFSRSKSGCANLHGFWTRNPGLKFRVQQTRISGPVNQDFGSTYPNFGSKNPNFGSTNPDFGSNNQNIGFTVLFFAKLTIFLETSAFFILHPDSNQRKNLREHFLPPGTCAQMDGPP